MARKTIGTSRLAQRTSGADINANFAELYSGLPFISPVSAEVGRRRTELTLYDLDLQPGQDISAKVQAVIDASDTPVTIIVPACGGTSNADSWLVDTAIKLKDNVRFVGTGGRDKSVLRRRNSNAIFSIEGTAAGVNDDAIISGVSLQSLTLDGGGRGFDVWTMLNCGLCFFRDVAVRNVASGGRSLWIKGQTQDSIFDNIFWEGGGSSDGSKAAIEISDDLSVDGHVQNLFFLSNHLESYYGPGIKIGGTSSTNLNPSLIHFISTKMESVNRNSTNPDIVLNACNRSIFDFRQIVSKGTSGTKPAIVQVGIGAQNTIRGVFAHMAGGSTLTRLIDMGTSNYSTVVISTDSATSNLCTADNLVQLGATAGNSVTIDNVGTGKMPTNSQLTSTDYNTKAHRTLGGILMSWVRVNAQNAIQNSNRLVELINLANSRYFGADKDNNLCGGDVQDISGAPRWRLNNTTGQATFTGGVRLNVLDTGPTLTSGAGAPTGTAPNGSMYLRTDGDATTTTYVRVAGAWVAK